MAHRIWNVLPGGRLKRWARSRGDARPGGGTACWLGRCLRIGIVIGSIGVTADCLGARSSGGMPPRHPMCIRVPLLGIGSCAPVPCARVGIITARPAAELTRPFSLGTIRGGACGSPPATKCRP